jgi:hypothetical protein
VQSAEIDRLGTQKIELDSSKGRDTQEEERVRLCSELSQLCLTVKPRIRGIKLRAVMDARIADWTAGGMQMDFLLKKLRQMSAVRQK